MRKLTIVLSIIALLATMGYFYGKPLLFRMWGLYPPEIETTATVTNFLKKHDARYDVLAVPKDMQAFKMLNKDLGIPGVVFFNNQLQTIKSSKGTGCPTTARNFVSELSTWEQETDTTYLTATQFSDFMNSLDVIDGGELLTKEKIATKAYDYIIVYGWCTYLPKQSLAMVNIGKAALVNKGKSILVVSVNLDFVNTWYKEAAPPDFFE